ncbi:DUF2478 domain-containing protein [Alcaligenaceae bacterium]|nr:DUF2478 domain-containing protein [Alcaligenaceae bacterium]
MTHIALAAIHRTSKEDPSDEILLRFATQLRKLGVRAQGVVQARETRNENGSRRMGIINVADGANLTISQDRGADSRGCCLNSGAIADATAILRKAGADSAELVFVNRFGMLEAKGDGFASDMLALISAGIPLITVVEAKYLDAWNAFNGGLATALPPDEAAVQAWYFGLPQACAPLALKRPALTAEPCQWLPN